MKENERGAQIQRVPKALESGKYTSLGEAAIAFNVPKSTWSSNGPSDSTQSTRKKSNYSPLPEEAIMKWIMKLDNWGFPPRRVA